MEEHRKHCFMRYLGVVLATLLGSFLAFYFLADMTLNKMMTHHNMMKRMHRVMHNERKSFDKFEDTIFDKDDVRINKIFKKTNIIDMIKTPDSYKFVVDLEPFRKNEKAISVDVNGSVLTINGETSANTKNGEYFTQVSQSYMLDDNANFDKLSKKKVEDKYIITIPIED